MPASAASIFSASRPSTAAIELVPAGAASAIALPRSTRLDHTGRIDRFGGGERRVFPDRVARGGGRIDAAAAQQPRQPDAHEAQGRLRVLREAELILAGGRQQVAEVDAGLGSAPIAERRDLRVFEELRSHAGLLRALAWKQERDLRRYSFALTTSRPA